MTTGQSTSTSTASFTEAASIDINAEGIACVQICAGGPLNITSSATARSLAVQLRSLANNESVRVVVFKGMGHKT